MVSRVWERYCLFNLKYLHGVIPFLLTLESIESLVCNSFPHFPIHQTHQASLVSIFLFLSLSIYLYISLCSALSLNNLTIYIFDPTELKPHYPFILPSSSPSSHTFSPPYSPHPPVHRYQPLHPPTHP